MTAARRSQPRNEVVELASRQRRRVPIELPAARNGGGDVDNQPMLRRIGAERVGAAEVHFPVLEDRSEIEIDDVVGASA